MPSTRTCPRDERRPVHAISRPAARRACRSRTVGHRATRRQRRQRSKRAAQARGHAERCSPPATSTTWTRSGVLLVQLPGAQARAPGALHDPGRQAERGAGSRRRPAEAVRQRQNGDRHDQARDPVQPAAQPRGRRRGRQVRGRASVRGEPGELVCVRLLRRDRGHAREAAEDPEADLGDHDAEPVHDPVQAQGSQRRLRRCARDADHCAGPEGLCSEVRQQDDRPTMRSTRWRPARTWSRTTLQATRRESGTRRAS